MASDIDPTKPTAGTALTADVRANFAAARAEIEALQNGTGIASLSFSTLTGTPTTLSGYGIADALAVGLKGAPSGLAELDAGGRVPAAQLPASVTGAVFYRGTWNAAANSPALASATGTQGDYYVVAAGGGTELDGIDDWAAGDWAVYNGAAWEKVDNGGLNALADDPAPQLGADLDPNGFGIAGPVPKARAASRTVTAATATTTDLDINGIVYGDSATAQTFTLHDPGAGGAAMIQFAQKGAGQITAAAAAGTLRYRSGDGPKSRGRYASLLCHFDGTDWWVEGGEA